MLFLDACHSGKGRHVGVMSAPFAEQLPAEGITVLSSCKIGEVAHECDELGHGVFSYFLAKGLEGAAADSAGLVTGDSLYRFVHREVVTWASQRGLRQTPWRFSEGTGDPVLIGRPRVRVRSQKNDEFLNLPQFHYGSVVPPDYYIDREKELDEAQAIIDAGKSFLLVGDRRSGKTSFSQKLIHQLMGRRDNSVLAAYLNLQICQDLQISTFLRETIDHMIGEIARQAFRCKATEIMQRNPGEGNSVLQSDTQFRDFVQICRLARRRSYPSEHAPRRLLDSHDFVCIVNDLLDIVRAKGWSSFAIFYDEANRLPGSFPTEILSSNVEALDKAGVVSVYAASPEMASSFKPLHESFPEQIHVRPFTSFEDIAEVARTLLLRRCFANYGAPDRCRGVAGAMAPNLPVPLSIALINSHIKSGKAIPHSADLWLQYSLCAGQSCQGSKQVTR
jgi:hypothetical protein